jgi:streptomycin 6-kinase
VKVPASLRRNILDLHGQAGREWLSRLPELLERCSAKWSLRLDRPYSNSSYSYVTRVTQPDGMAAVLKLSFPDEGAIQEAAALHKFGGRGTVELFAYEPSIAALLLARAQPGDPLAELSAIDDQQATSVVANVARALHREAPSADGFPCTDLWPLEIERLSNIVERNPSLRGLTADARAVVIELAASGSEHVLLHGDLHHFNILNAGEEWVAIDPKGIAGERECEIGPFVLNPIRPDLARILTRRMAQLCEELALDRRRAWAWTFVRAVLAILWALEDHGEAPAEWIECLQILRSIQ